MRSRLTGSVVLDVRERIVVSTSGIRCSVNIVPLNIKPLRCLETSGINRSVTLRHIPRDRRTPQEITELRVCRMSFCCVLMCKVPCCCVLVCMFSVPTLRTVCCPCTLVCTLYWSFFVCKFHILFVCTRPCIFVYTFIFLCLCICLCFLGVRMSAPFVNIMTRIIFLFRDTKQVR